MKRSLLSLSMAAFVAAGSATVCAGGALPEPTVFSRGVISTDEDISSPSFASDNRTLLLSRGVGGRPTIVESTAAGDGWAMPIVAAFSGRWRDMDPVFGPDGSYAIFVSLRPVDGRPADVASLWRVDRTATDWGDPVHLPATVNIGTNVYAPSIASDGTIYFLSSDRQRKHQLYRARLRNGTYSQAEPLSFSNPATHDYDPETAPDQSFVIFPSSGRNGPDTKLHLYIAFARGASWGPVRRIRYRGDDSAGGSNDSSPMLSRDQRTLYFASDRDGGSAIWALPTAGWLSPI